MFGLVNLNDALASTQNTLYDMFIFFRLPYLVEKGFQVGKSRTVVDSMIKKRIKRERILNQPIILEEYKDIRLGVLKN